MVWPCAVSCGQSIPLSAWYSAVLLACQGMVDETTVGWPAAHDGQITLADGTFLELPADVAGACGIEGK